MRSPLVPQAPLGNALPEAPLRELGRSATLVEYRASRWGFVGDGTNPERPDKKLIQKAIRKYGAVAVGMAVNVRFQNYAFPVFTEDVKWQRNAKGQIINGHAVALVGWDEDKDNGDGTRGAWLLRNSWGTKWGGNDNEIGAGYLWVKYGVSYIGSYAAWIEPTGST